MKILFDIKYRQQIESGKYKVVTASDKPVKIERWDMKGSSPILASMMVNVCDYEGENEWEEERAFSYNNEGRCPSKSPSDSKYQLYIETGDDLTRAERMLYNLVNDHVYNCDSMTEGEVVEWMKDFVPVVEEEIKQRNCS